MALSVKISNELVKESCSLSLHENRLVMYAVTCLGDDINDEIKIPLKDYAKLYKLCPANCKRDFLKASESLYGRSIEVVNGDERRRMHWVITEGRCAEGKLIIQFHPKLAPHLLELKNCFTVYDLSRAGDFKLRNSWRLFLLLMQFRTTGKLYRTPEQIIDLFDLSDYYAQDFSRVRNKILKPVLKEIKDKAKLDVTLSVEKKANKTSKLLFEFPTETQLKLPVSKPSPKTSPEQLAKNAQRAEDLAEITGAITLAKNAGEPIDKFIPKRLIELAKPFLKAEKETVTTI